MRRPALSNKIVIGIDKLLAGIEFSDLLDSCMSADDREHINSAIDYLEKLVKWKKEKA